jgi:hypothetical protein
MTKRQSTRWLLSMMEKYNVSEEGVREIMRQRQQQSMEARRRKDIPHRGGFSDKELAKAAGKRGAAARWGTTTTESSQD